MLKYGSMQDKTVDNRTKVLYMITKGNWGGAQEYVYTLATSLPEKFYKVTVICGEGNILPRKLEEKGVIVHSLPTLMRDISLRNEIRSFFALIKIIRNIRPDILHLNSSKIGFLGALAGRMARVPKIIFTAHGWASNEETRRYATRGIFYIIHSITVLLCHNTIAVSERTKKDMSLSWVRNKIQVIYNGIGNIEFLSREKSREILNNHTGTDLTPHTMIGTISELHTNKGLDVLIEASKRLPDHVGIYIIGSGEEKESLQIKIAQNSLSSRIFLLGRIEDAKQYLKAFDIFTLTSRAENLPYVILEAGKAGLPVVASKVGGIPEMIENGESGILVNKNNPGEVSRALEYLLDNPEIRKRYGKNLKQTIDQKFSIDGMIQKTVGVYLN